MKDVAERHKHIQKRGQSYGVRVPVPRHLQDISGKKEITRTLSTRDKKEAEKAYPDVLKRVYLEFEKAEAKLKPTDKASLSGFDPLTAVRKRHNSRREEILRSTKAEFSNDHEIEEARQRLRDELVELTSRQIHRSYNFVETQAYDFLFEFGVPTCSETGQPNVDTADPRHHDLHEHLIASNIELKELALERHGEKLSRTPNGNIVSQSAMAEEEGRRISERTKAALCAAKERGVELGKNGKVLAKKNKQEAAAYAQSIIALFPKLGLSSDRSLSSIAGR